MTNNPQTHTVHSSYNTQQSTCNFAFPNASSMEFWNREGILVYALINQETLS